MAGQSFNNGNRVSTDEGGTENPYNSVGDDHRMNGSGWVGVGDHHHHVNGFFGGIGNSGNGFGVGVGDDHHVSVSFGGIGNSGNVGVGVGVGEDHDGSFNQPTNKKQRLIWTKALHADFVNAINSLGGPNRAFPKQILSRMKAMGHTNLQKENISSHLQKHREYLKQQAGNNSGEGTSGNTSLQNVNSSTNHIGDGLSTNPIAVQGPSTNHGEELTSTIEHMDVDNQDSSLPKPGEFDYEQYFNYDSFPSDHWLDEQNDNSGGFKPNGLSACFLSDDDDDNDKDKEQ